MIIKCGICLELFEPTCEIDATNCGHVFHRECVKQWVARRPTCPTCRAHVTKEKLLKLHINAENNEQTDANKLRIEDLQKQINEKDDSILNAAKQIEYLKRDNKQLSSQNKRQGKKILDFEVTMRNRNRTIRNQKQQLKDLTKESKNLQQQLNAMKRKLDPAASGNDQKKRKIMEGKFRYNLRRQN